MSKLQPLKKAVSTPILKVGKIRNKRTEMDFTSNRITDDVKRVYTDGVITKITLLR